jgi:hypothetical protein
MTDVQAYDVQSFAKAYGISRAQVYVEIKFRRLRIFKVGRRTLISRESAAAWQHKLESAAASTRVERTAESDVGQPDHVAIGPPIRR